MEKPKTKVVLGVCAQSRKANGKPMKQILAKMIEFYSESLEILVFPEKTIHEEPIEKWPICDALVCFYSHNFPLEKAGKYVEKNKIWCLNDIEKQFDLLNRATTYEIMKANGIPVTRYEVMWRDDYPSKPHGFLQEYIDAIVVNGVTFTKPFVEKPVSSEDHNIRIYYPQSAGGGSQQLFRKILDKSSSYSTENSVRKNGSFIYEDFLQTDGTDVKVYAVGPNYAHAEARKSPALDGRVNRDAWGSEVRHPVILSHTEKLIARKVVLAFKQTVCGFDLLRSDSKSYVCDVNGFSFVKKSMKYYEDAAQILGNIILQMLRPSETKFQREYMLADKPPVAKVSTELRCLIAVIRHGDRTPKQKLKMTVKDKRFLAIFEKYRKDKKKVKLKQPQQLQEVLDVGRALLTDIDKDLDICEDQTRLEQLKMVLEMHSFSGINRKVQFRQETDSKSKQRLLLIVKWGGELTEAGKRQAEHLGKAFRCLYPGGGQYDNDKEGLGFLRLHSTYRHDLKIYASDEGRVKMTAAAFTKGLLALEGELPPILMQMVKSSTTEDLLGDDKEERQYLSECKTVLRDYLQVDKKLTKSDMNKLNPTEDKSIKIALKTIGNPKHLCEKLSNLIDTFCESIEREQESSVEDSDNPFAAKRLYGDETWSIMYSRWKKLSKDFRILDDDGNVKQYDVLKIPDIYDSIKYDIEHNTRALPLNEMQEIFTTAKRIADVVVPQKFGITKEEKFYVAQQICTPLVKKMLSDIKRVVGGNQEEENLTRLDANATNEDIAHPFRHIRSRIYFTSESHIHPLMNLIRFDLLSQRKDDQFTRALDFLSYITEFNYLSQVVLMLFEDTSKDVQSASRFHLEVHFSPGMMNYLQTDNIPDLGYRSHAARTDPTTTSSSEKTKRSVRAKTTLLNSPSEDLTIFGLKMENYTRTQKVQTPSGRNNDAVSRTERDKLSNIPDNPYEMMSAESPDSSEFLLSARSPDSSSIEVITVKEKTPWASTFMKKLKNFLSSNNVANRFQSTKIITDKSAGKKENKPLSNVSDAPAMMTTAIIGAGINLDVCESENLDSNKNFYYFIPPIRALETLHNHISLQEVVNFMDRTISDKWAYPTNVVKSQKKVVAKKK